MYLIVSADHAFGTYVKYDIYFYNNLISVLKRASA